MPSGNMPSYEEHLRNMLNLGSAGRMGNDPQALRSLAPDSARWNHHHCFYLLDFTKNGFAHFDPNAIHVMGQHAEAFYEGGTEFTKWIGNTNDWKVLNMSIFPANHLFLSDAQKHDPQKYRVSYNFRTKTKDGQWISVLQQSSMAYSEQYMLPVLSFGTLINISDHKSNSKIVHRIEHLGANGSWKTDLLKFYFPDLIDAGLMTRTEIEILKWLADGYSSKQIADRFHRSLHTVNTHRRNILEKTNAKNTADLLRFAISQGII